MILEKISLQVILEKTYLGKDIPWSDLGKDLYIYSEGLGKVLSHPSSHRFKPVEKGAHMG